MLYNILEKIEDRFLDHPKIKGQPSEDLYFSICRALTTIKHIIYHQPKNFIYNIWNYRKMLVSDYWFDSYFLIRMIQLKLDNDRRKYLKYGMTVESERISKEMEYCSLILKKIGNDNYEEDHLKDHDKKWGKIYVEDYTTNNVCIYRKNAKTKKEKEQETKEFNQHITEAYEEKVNDTTKVFNFISNKIHTWWD